MSDQTPRPRRRRIAGETPAPAPSTPVAKKAPAKKAPAKKAPAKKSPVEKTQPPAGTSAPAKKASAAPAKPTAKAPTSKVASAVAARDTGAPRPKSNRPPASTPSTGASRVREPETSGRTSSPVPLLVSLVVLVAGLALAVVGFVHWRGESFDASRESAVSFASDAAETIFSFSHDDLEAHEQESKALMTGSFAEEYDTIAPALEDLAPQREVEVTAVVRGAAALPCGVECRSDRASVLMFVDLDRRLGDDDAPALFPNRLVADLVKSDGEWKVDDLRAL